MNHSDPEFQKQIEVWRVLPTPLAEKVEWILVQRDDPDRWFAYQRMINLLNRLRGKAMDPMRGYPKEARQQRSCEKLL